MPFKSLGRRAAIRSSSPNAAIVPELETAHGRPAKRRRLLRRAARRHGQRRAAGPGGPLYDKLDADIAYAMMGINAVKGVEIGGGFGVVEQKGSEHGDELTPEGFPSNHAGGVLGGISTGQDIEVSIAIKPTSSIRCHAARSTATTNRRRSRRIGRHDPCVGIRATPIAEAMLALVLMDHALLHRAQNADVRLSVPPIPGRGG